MNKQFHLTSSPTASLFDIWAEGSLRTSIKPAWQYLCRILQSRYPVQLEDILKYSDEIYYIILLIVEEYNLRRQSASITESFYELTRQCSSPRHSFMFRQAKLISLISFVILPYIIDKLDIKYKEVKEQMLIHPQSVSVMKKRFLQIYPKLLTVSKWLQIGNYICYVFSYTGYGNPLLYITRMQLKYDSNIPVKCTSKIGDQKLYIQILSGITNTLASMFMKLIPFLLHSLQYVDVFYQKNILANASSSICAIFAPPMMPKVISADVKLPPSEKQCPLCRQTHKNPATLSISGFVFCYSCIFQYVQTYRCCPITYRPLDLKDIVMLRP